MMKCDDLRGLIELYGTFLKKISETYDILFQDSFGDPVEDVVKKTALTGCFLKELAVFFKEYEYVLSEFEKIKGFKHVRIILKEHREEFAGSNRGGHCVLVGVLDGAEVHVRPPLGFGNIIVFPNGEKGIMEEEQHSFAFFSDAKDVIVLEVFYRMNPQAKKSRENESFEFNSRRGHTV